MVPPSFFERQQNDEKDKAVANEARIAYKLLDYGYTHLGIPRFDHIAQDWGFSHDILKNSSLFDHKTPSSSRTHPVENHRLPSLHHP
jgi:hypothetical protein